MVEIAGESLECRRPSSDAKAGSEAAPWIAARSAKSRPITDHVRFVRISREAIRESPASHFLHPTRALLVFKIVGCCEGQLRRRHATGDPADRVWAVGRQLASAAVAAFPTASKGGGEEWYASNPARKSPAR